MDKHIRPTWFTLRRHEDPPVEVDPPGDPAEGAAAEQPGEKPTHEDPRIAELRRERDRRRVAEKAAADAAAKVKEFEDRDKSEQQKLAERADAAEKAAQEANERALRAEVAIAKGLPPALASRLQGDSREAMEADADALLELVPAKTSPPAPAAAGVGVGGKPPTPTDFRSADDAEVDAELRKLGVKRW